jgi:ComF family protein
MSLVDLIYPRTCPVCRKIVRPGFTVKDDEKRLPEHIGMEKLICPHCYNRVPFIAGPVCMKCGKPLANAEAEYCRQCEKTPRDFVRNLALMDYSDETADRMMWDLKYSNKREYADFLALELGRHFGRRIVDWGCEAIVPVPVHASKKRVRGYNQTAVLAKRLGAFLELPVDEGALLRIRKTAPQKNLNAGERYLNLKTAFAPGKSAARYRRVLLLDDIYTTGATMQVCTKALMGAGVEQVYGITCCVGREAE